MAIVTLENVKKFLEVGQDDQKKDFLINLLIDGATQIAKKQLWRRDIESTSYNVYLNGDGTNYIWGLQYPITAITTFTIDDTAMVEASDYEYYANEGYIYLYSKSTIDRKNIHLVYTAGYASNSIPASAKIALYSLIKFYYERKNNAELTNQGGNQLESLTFNLADIPDHIQRMFDADSYKTLMPA